MGSDLHRPDGTTAIAAAVVVHPHPAMGGDRNHPLVVAIAEGLAQSGVVALRPDLTDPDTARSASRLEALASELVDQVGEDLVLVGYSWGSIVAAMVSAPRVVARALVAPPVAMTDLGPGDGVPTLVLVPAHDQYGGPAAVRAAVGGWDATEIDVVDGADHFLTGAVARVADQVVDWVSRVVTADGTRAS
jgi:alpha/beta superfamily hydrolase